ncbi:hypothetical protein F5884DRAFT_868572 [Xylogone sp. PMI_703]|nr:hypothetical protein F5884DRAFT_868572 [Xylogone sp. PMI_703]
MAAVAAVGATSGNSVDLNSKGHGGTKVQNGLTTPEGTPAVDEGRIDADKARRKEEEKDKALQSGYYVPDESDSDDEEDSGNGSEDEMKDIQNEIPWPTKFVQDIYNEATPHLGKLMFNPTDLDALSKLKALNDKIKERNEEDDIEPDQWIIDSAFFASSFEMARPIYEGLLKRPQGQPIDEEAKGKLEEINTQIQAKTTKHHYPKNWTMNPPTEEAIENFRRLKEETDKAEAQKRLKRREKRIADKAAAEKAAAEKAAAEKAAAEKVAAEKAAAEKAAAEKAAADAAAKNAPGKIQYPWKTLPLPDGREIIAGRQHTRFGKLDGKSTLVVASDQGDDPTFVVTTGGAVGALEVEEYFNLSGIKLLAEKKSNGDKAKTWTWRDKEDFVDLVWVAVGDRKLSRFGKNPRAGECQCCVKMKSGLELCTRSDLASVISKMSADNRIKKYCERKEITPPWDVRPKEQIVATEILDSHGISSFNSASTAAGGSATGNLEIKSLQNQMAALERKFEGFQSSTANGSSLESLLAKLDERMSSIETKVAKIDTLEDTSAKLAGFLNALAARFDKLEKRVPEAQS